MNKIISEVINPVIAPTCGIIPLVNKLYNPSAPIDCKIEKKLPAAIVPPNNDIIYAAIDPNAIPAVVKPNNVKAIKSIKGDKKNPKIEPNIPQTIIFIKT